MDIKIIKRDPLTLADMSRVISKLGKKSELPTIQQKVKTFAKKFSKMKDTDVAKLAEELRSLEIPMFNNEYIIQIINVLPQDLAELRAIFAGAKTTISSENFKKILDVVLKHTKK